MLDARARMSHERTADAVDLMDMHAGATCALSNAVCGTLVPLYYLLRAARCRAHARGARTCPGAAPFVAARIAATVPYLSCEHVRRVIPAAHVDIGSDGRSAAESAHTPSHS